MTYNTKRSIDVVGADRDGGKRGLPGSPLRTAADFLKSGSFRWYEFGFCFCWAFQLSFAHFGIIQNIVPAHYEAGVLAERLSLPFAVLALALAATRLSRPVGLRKGPWVAGFFQALAIACICASALTGVHGAILVPVAGLFVGVSSGMFLSLWHRFFGTQERGRAIVIMVSSWLLANCIAKALPLLPHPAVLAILALILPPLSTGTLLKSARLDSFQGSFPAFREAARDLWRPSVSLMLLALFWQLFLWLSHAGENGSAGDLDIALIFVAAAFTLALSCSDSFGAGRVFQALVPVVATLLVVFPFAPVGQSELFRNAFLLCFEVLCFSLMCLCVETSQAKSWEPQYVFSLVLLPEYFGLGAGYAGGMLLDAVKTGIPLLSIGASLVGIYLLCITAFLVLRVRGSGRKGEAKKGSSPENDASLPSLQAIAKEKRLTRRETEVFMYLAKGYSLPSIGEELCVSVNTLKRHTSNIYAKMEIHTRQELIALVQEALR